MNGRVLRLGLLAGSSEHRGFSLGPGPGRALFRVGSAIECNWRIVGPGIAPHHLMLLWKEQVLTVVDVGAGQLFVNGEAFHLCRQIEGGRIQFGSGEILVTPSMPVGPGVDA